MFNPGDKFDKYTLVRPLGEGGMGVVWEAKNPFGLPVVLKMLQPSLRANSDVIERFEREGRIQYTLKHPNIVRVTDIVESEDGLPALVVDFMKGRDLEERLYANGALSIEETVQIGSKVLDALQLAHEHGFFHRDLKPSNIFLEEVGTGFEPRLMDFGIAKIQAAAQLTRAQEFCGTPAYASPEQIASTKDVDHLTDIYSFGVLMWSMCTGHEPYRDMNDDPYSVLAAVVREELPTLPDTIPEWLTNIVTKATRKPKAERFQSAAEFRDALLNAAQDLSIYTPAGFDDDLGHAVDPRASESTDEVPVVKQGAAVTTTETEVSVPSLDSETDDDESATVRAKAHAEEERAREKRQAQGRDRLAPNPEPLAPTTPLGATFEDVEGAFFGDDSNDHETAQHANRKPPKASSRERARAREVKRSFSGKRRLPKKTLWLALFVLALITGGAIFSYQYLNAATPAPAGFARVESGRFIMGSPINENGRARDERQHEVTITRPFAVQISEVTRAEWHNIMYSEPNGFEDCGENCPITDVTWVDAARFANRVSVEAGTEQCYEINDGNVEWPRGLDCTGYRLPTEAEWEYAARGGTESALFTGEIQYPGREVLDPHMSVIGWYASNSDAAYIDSIDCQSWGEDRDRCGVQPVNERRGNPWGLHDMHGNASEWVWDRYGPYPEGGVTDPLGASSGTQRVIRGGNWRSTAENCRAATRDKSQSVARMTIGIRLVRTLR